MDEDEELRSPSAITTSPEVAELFAALIAAQAEFGAVVETNDNPFFKSKYADLAALVQATMPVLATHKLGIVQAPGFDGAEATLTTRVVHVSGQWLEATMAIYPTKMDPQAQGAAITYARRYAYGAMLGIITEPDDDGNSTKTAAVKPKRAGRTAEEGPGRLPAHLTKLQIMFKQKGFVTSEGRHAFATTVLKKEVANSRELSYQEVAAIAGALSELEDVK